MRSLQPGRSTRSQVDMQVPSPAVVVSLGKGNDRESLRIRLYKPENRNLILRYQVLTWKGQYDLRVEVGDEAHDGTATVTVRCEQSDQVEERKAA